jgi:hypothetical protein
MKYFRLLVAVLIVACVSSANAFDIPFFPKKYATIEECKRFTPKVTNQDLFVNDVCEALFDESKKPSAKSRDRLLCWRSEINSASTIGQSRNSIFTCFEKYPTKNQSDGLSLAQNYFKTAEELAREQIINQPRQRQLPPLGMNCMIIGNMIDCL